MNKKEIEIISKIKSKGFWEIEIRPLKYEENKLERAKCQQLIKECQVQLLGWNFPYIIDSVENFFVGPNYVEGICDLRRDTEIWRFYQSGQFVQYRAFWEDWEPNAEWHLGFRTDYSKDTVKKVKGIVSTLYEITGIFKFASNLANKEIFDERLKIILKLNDTVNRSLAMSDPFRILYKDYKCMIEQVIFQQEYSVNDIKTNFADLAMKATVEIFASFNWLSIDIQKALKPDQDNALK